MTDGPVNPLLGYSQKIFKALVWEPLVQAGMIYAETQAPFLAAPVIKQVFELSVRTFADKAFAAIVMIVDVQAIRLLSDAHQRAYDEASLRLMVLAVDYGIESPEFKKERENAKVALSQFTNISHA